MDNLNNERQNGMVAIAIILVLMIVQAGVFLYWMFGDTAIEWWKVFFPTIALFAFIMLIIVYFCGRIIMLAIHEWLEHKKEKID